VRTSPNAAIDASGVDGDASGGLSGAYWMARGRQLPDERWGRVRHANAVATGVLKRRLENLLLSLSGRRPSLGEAANLDRFPAVARKDTTTPNARRDLIRVDSATCSIQIKGAGIPTLDR